MSFNDKLAQFLPKNPEYVVDPRKWAFWRDSFIIFWVFSFLGHWIEFAWMWPGVAFGGNEPSYPPLFAIAIPYGLGVLAMLWFVYPLLVRKKIGAFGAFVMSALVCTAVEFVCAAITYSVHGNNVYWDYSDEFMNLFGFVCLRNSLAFGVAALLVLYGLFPLVDKAMKKLGRVKLNVIFWVLFIGYLGVRAYILFTTGSVFGG